MCAGRCEQRAAPPRRTDVIRGRLSPIISAPALDNRTLTQTAKKMKNRLFRVDLRRLILCMCLFFVFLALVNNLYASYKVQREVLLHNTLEVNHVYAQKLAQVANSYITSSKRILETVSFDISKKEHDSRAIQQDLARIARMTRSFNSLFFSDASGRVLAALPTADKLAGTTLRSGASLDALKLRHPTISPPFKAPSGRWLVQLSHPVFQDDGSYAGFVAGTIYLHSPNALQTVLGEHFYSDGSYIYVVDQNGLLIYHPVKRRLGTSNLNNLAVQRVVRGEHGTMRLTNTGQIDMLAGYAPIPATGWGIVVQRPAQAAMASLDDLFWRTLYYSLPITLLSLLGIWWLATLISRPLRQLADVAAQLDDRPSFNRIHLIKGWYVEVALIRKALLAGLSAVTTRMSHLHRQTETDPLTSLINRRGLESALAALKQEGLPVAAVMFDIDHFKLINDTYGHIAGDEALVTVANIARTTARETDVIARMGGEEFVVLLPNATQESALAFAERLRQGIAEAQISQSGPVTVSLGVALYPEHTKDLDSLLPMADTALYQAKKAGRNCIQVANRPDEA